MGEKGRENGGIEEKKGKGERQKLPPQKRDGQGRGCPFNVFLGCFCVHFCVLFFEAGSQAMESQR